MIVARGLLLVRPPETDETLPGGLIALVAETRERMTASQCEVIAVGAPEACDPSSSRAARKCERIHGVANAPNYSLMRVHLCPVAVGDWLLVRPRSFILGPSPERKEWFVAQDAVIAILGRGEE